MGKMNEQEHGHLVNATNRFLNEDMTIGGGVVSNTGFEPEAEEQTTPVEVDSSFAMEFISAAGLTQEYIAFIDQMSRRSEEEAGGCEGCEDCDCDQ